MQTKTSVFFPGLNGVRAIAASIVLTWHAMQFRQLLGLRGSLELTEMAGYAVTMFFVLSGFLITYLLLQEQDRFGKISRRRFYLRRMLRIWPIYYLVVGLALLALRWLPPSALPHGSLSMSIGCYLLFMPNLAYASGMRIGPLAPLWSVGVEEQFYAFWPLLLGRARAIPFTLLAVIGTCVLAKFTLRFLHNVTLINLCWDARFDCMAIGGLGAWWVYRGMQGKAILFSPWTQGALWTWLAWSVLRSPVHLSSLLDHELHSLVYLGLILNVSCNPKTLISLENRVFDYLGRISYGLYVYHVPAIYILHRILPGRIPEGRIGAIAAYGIFGILTLALASVSYAWIEQPFLRLKERFARVPSRNSPSQVR